MAEARILVRPDTSGFRAELEAALKAATKPITIPVVPVVAQGKVSGVAAAAQAAAAGQQEVAAAAQAAGAATQTAASSTVRLTAAQTAAAVAAQKYAFSQSEVVGASSAVAAAQVTLTRSTAAVAAAEKAVSIALRENNAALIANTQETLANAAAQQLRAKSSLAEARADAARAASLNQLGRGAGGAGLQLFGLRGATLAASGAFLAGTAAIIGFSKAVKSAAALETELNVFRVTAGATAEEMERVAAAARSLGRDITLPGVTAGTAAIAMTELAKAGLSVQDSLDGARGTLQLATAAQIDVKDATELVAGALNSFKLQGDDAVKVADLLAGAAKESQGEISDMGTALAQASAVSRQFGVSIEDTVTLLTQLAQAGIAGGRAGTSLRVAFLRLVNPPAAAAKELDKLNVKLRDVEGNLRPEVFTDIAKAMRDYTTGQKAAALATIFGSDAIRAAGIIGAEGAGNFRELRDAITQQGLAADAAAARTQGLEGSFQNLSNQADTLGLTVGNVVKGPLKIFTDGLASQVSAANDSAEGISALAGVINSELEKTLSNVPFFDKFDDRLGDIAKATLLVVNPLSGQLALAGKAFQLFGGDVEEATGQLSEFNRVSDVTAGQLEQAIKSAIKVSAQGLNVKQVENIITGFDAQETRARIAKDNAKLLDVFNDEQAFLERQLNRDYVKRRPALQRAIEQALLGTINDIASVQSQAESKAKKAKDDARRAAADAASAVKAQEQALLSDFGVERDQKANAIAAAALKAGLQDDIKAQQALKALVLRQIAAVKERISVAGGKKAALAALRAIEIQVNAALESLNEQQRQAAEERRQGVLDSTRLDIDFAEISDNQQAEVTARRKLIKQLQEQQALVKKGTVAWKELRNQIAQQNAAIAEVTKEKQKENNAAGQANFEFLQAQQGFASSLLGNLIPRGATGGLVGGGAPVQAALQPQAGVAEGKSRSGVTSGQAQTTNAILGGILQQLKILNGDNVAPEARRQNAWQNATMDY